jgi:transcription antitermination factor NusG
MGLIVKEFNGFEDKDFRAFDEKKWQSQAFNLERMAVRDKLELIGSSVEDKLNLKKLKLRIETSAPVPGVSNSHRVRDMWLYFMRTESEEKDVMPLIDRVYPVEQWLKESSSYRRHLILFMRIDCSGVEAGLRIHSRAWIDWQNFINRTKNFFEMERLNAIVQSLPESFFISECSGEEEKPVNKVNIRAFRFDEEYIKTLEEKIINEDIWFMTGKIYSSLDSEIRTRQWMNTYFNIIDALIPLYNFITWKNTSDYLSIAETIKKEKEMISSHAVDCKKGDRVIIAAGPFNGKHGVVTDMDTKGTLKILVGKIQLRVDGRNIKKI